MAVKVILDKLVEQGDGTYIAYIYAINDQTQEILESTSLPYLGNSIEFRNNILQKFQGLTEKIQKLNTAIIEINTVISDIDLSK
jgi:hypothetical protein